MHTTQTSHHRIFFSNVTNRSLLNDLASIIGMDTTEDENVFDLIQSEGESTIVCDVLSDTFPERLLPVGCRDAYDMTFDEIVIALKKLADEQSNQLISRLFEVSRYQTGVNDMDIDCDELFDLLIVLGDSHFTVDGIYTQWAMSSNKNLFGAHAGGARVTTQRFCVPCCIVPDRAETVIRTLAVLSPDQMGDYFVNEFMNPVMDGIKSPVLRDNVKVGLLRHMQYKTVTPSDISEMIGGLALTTEADNLKDLRPDEISEGVRLLGEAALAEQCGRGLKSPLWFTGGLTDSEEIWAMWNGIAEVDILSGKVLRPSDLEEQVTSINMSLDYAEVFVKSPLYPEYCRTEKLWMVHQGIMPAGQAATLTPAETVVIIAERVELLLLRRKDIQAYHDRLARKG